MKGRPNFFIVGAPKSGTTSMHQYLSQHPDIFMSVRKEPCYLAPDFLSPTYPQNEEDYYRCFEGYDGESRVGESTSTYLYSRLAAKRIHEYEPNAKIIAMLRNPVDLVPSLHAQRLKEGGETIVSLEKAIEAEEDRRQGRRIPVGFMFPREYLLYREYGKYSEQLKRYFDELGRENVHVIIFEDFIRNTKEEVAGVCQFLGVSSSFTPDLLVHNPAGMPRSVLLHRFLTLLTPKVVEFGKYARIIIPSRLLKLLGRVYGIPGKLNMKLGRSVVDKETQKTLAIYFGREIIDVEMLLERDLSCWRQD